MLQRTQTLFLLLAVAALALSFVFPIANIMVNGKTEALYTNYGLKAIDAGGKTTLVESGFIYIVAAGALLFLLFAISQFKKRALQMKICRVSYLIILAQFALCFFMPDQAAKTIKAVGEIKVGTYGIAFYAPLVALVFTYLAERFIKRDEELVRSADRLR